MNESYFEIERIKSVGLSKTIYPCIKRFFDIIFGFIGCAFIIPIGLIVKIAYLLDGDFAPIFYTQDRIGKNGKVIKIYKFRTMVKDANNFNKYLTKEQIAEFKKNFKLDNDPRITKIGRFLRKTSLDELPQFINVFVGEMSLIGPRPVVYQEISKLGNKKNLILSVLPGITGWWACNGRSCTSYKKRVELEAYYAKNMCFTLDVKCFFLTIKAVITRKGAK